ncbi:mechanosensitive ion channel family protein [Plebeiibacterium marinum]|uniref:Mechanosensitive ion channel family protein n=1 Tax=Plebeiibacterium marinum TaxID=2992111 RepID=A0AAE3SLD4_9BACT|nr:mechanosensitive ion channel domain-containing protein [Plebeiobacterium marinum]MCW3807488.1 mechanosensitive ion channel family protein [Plebeiobacterium marinum]
MIELNNIFEKTIAFLPKIGLGIIVLSLFVLVSWLIKSIIIKRIKPKTKNPLLAVFLGKLVAFTITITGFVFFLNVIGLGGIAKHIMAGAGITTFIIGFAFKDIGENFLSGILMAFKSPFKIGDLIETNGTVGYVNELNTRDSVIKTLDGIDVYIPNSQLIKAPLFNYTIDGFLRYEIAIGLDYSSDIKKIKDLIINALLNIPEVLQGDKKPVVVIDELAVSTINVKVLYWIDTFKSKSRAFHLQVKTKVIEKLLNEFNANNVYLPADIIEVKNYKENIFKTEFEK